MQESTFFSFNRDRLLERLYVTSPKYVKKQAHSARKTCRMNVKSEKITNFTNKVCRMCFRGLFPFQRMWWFLRLSCITILEWEDNFAICWFDGAFLGVAGTWGFPQEPRHRLLCWQALRHHEIFVGSVQESKRFSC